MGTSIGEMLQPPGPWEMGTAGPIRQGWGQEKWGQLDQTGVGTGEMGTTGRGWDGDRSWLDEVEGGAEAGDKAWEQRRATVAQAKDRD